MGFFQDIFLTGGKTTTQEGIKAVGSNILHIAWVVAIIIIIVAVASVGLYFLWRHLRYNIPVMVVDIVGGTPVIRKDRAGIFLDRKSGNKLFFVRRNKMAFDPDKVRYTLTEKAKVAMFINRGHKNMRPLEFNFENTRFYMSVGEEDVNWSLNIIDASDKLVGQSMLMQLMPYITLAFVSMVVLVIFYYLIKKFDVLDSLGQHIENAATALRDARQGTIVS